MKSELAPGFLVASPNMKDPHFAHSLVLLVEAGEDGAMGFIVNRKLDVTLADLQDDLELELRAERAAEAVHFGGPVQSERGWLLVDQRGESTDDLDAAMSMDGALDVVTSLDTLRIVLTENDARAVKLVLGYAGWGSAQLEDEIREGAWIPLDFDPALVFDGGEREAWAHALERIGLDPAIYWGGGANA